MEKFQNVVIIISSILSTHVIILIAIFVFRKALMEKIKGLLLFEIAKGDFIIKMLFSNVDNLVTIKEKSKKQTAEYLTSKSKEINTTETEIIHIYSEIEKAIKLKLKTDDSFDTIVSLYEGKKIDTDMFIILDSMRTLRDNIHITARSREISKEEIANYRYNANRIIEIIQNMDVKETD